MCDDSAKSWQLMGELKEVSSKVGLQKELVSGATRGSLRGVRPLGEAAMMLLARGLAVFEPHPQPPPQGSIYIPPRAPRGPVLH